MWQLDLPCSNKIQLGIAKITSLFSFLLAGNYIHLISAESRLKWIGKRSCEIYEEVDTPVQENRNSHKWFFF
jgi:hypothetical protein